MNKKINYLFIVIIFFTAGWSSIPKSDYPAEIQRVFPASFDQTWNAIMEVVNLYKGNFISKDKSSGIIVFSVSDTEQESEIKQVFVNIYLKSQPGRNLTLVYLFPKIKPKIKNGIYCLYSGKIDKDFFNELEKFLVKK